jgi:hypothetical protein
MESKVCTKCNESKTLDNYFVDPRMRDGLGSDCKDCCKIARQQRYQKNRSRELEQMKLWKQSHPEYQKQWQLKNPTYFRDYRRKLRA